LFQILQLHDHTYAYSIEHGIESSGFVLGTALRITGDVSGRGSRFPENLEF
jgi:hypothetical protein